MDPSDQTSILAALPRLDAAALERLVEYHDYQYWVLDRPVLADEVYDLLVRRLTALAPGSEVLGRIGGRRDREPALGRRVLHPRPMLSLDKCYTEAEFRQWLELLRGLLREAPPRVEDLPVLLTPKIDGVAAALRYGADGRLAEAATRGDGREGEDFTVNARLIPGIPWQVEIPGLEVRGEVYLRRSIFTAKYAGQFANPRNLAAGTLKQKESARAQLLDLSFFAYDAEGLDAATEVEKLHRLAALGFTAPAPRERRIAREVPAAFEAFAAAREGWDFDADGVVVKLDDVPLHATLGATAHHPRNAIAFKFQGDSGFSMLREVHWNVSRTGRVTPVAVVDPVLLSGASVSRCSLHNIGIFRSHGLQLGDRVQVTRRGGVIPNLEASLGGGDRPVEIPRACPSCGRETFLLAPQLFLGGIRVSREASPEDRRILADDRLALVRAELLADLVGTTSRVARRSPSSEKGEVFHGGDRPYRETLTWRARGDLEAESRVRARFEALPSLEPPAARLAAVLVLDPGSPASHAALRDALDLCRERPLRLVVLPVPDGHLGDGVSEAWQALRDAASSGRTWEALCAQAGIPGVPAGFKPREGRLAGTPPDDLLALAADLCDDVLSCAAPAACRDAQVGRLLHFARTLGVEGFGPRHMETLVDQGLLRGLPDLFRLRFEDLVPLDRMGEVLARKLLDEIQRARTPTLARFLASLGVDELAGSVSELLEREAGSLERVLALREAELGAFPQVNFTIAHQVLAGLRRLRPVLEELRPFVTLRGPGSPVAGAGPFAGRSFVFTGRMATLERKEAQARVRALGGLTPDGVVKGLDFLVVGDEGSPLFGHGRKGAKLEKAEAWGIRILSETEFLERLREAGATQEAGVVATRPDTE